MTSGDVRRGLAPIPVRIRDPQTFEGHDLEHGERIAIFSGLASSPGAAGAFAGEPRLNSAVHSILAMRHRETASDRGTPDRHAKGYCARFSHFKVAPYESAAYGLM